MRTQNSELNLRHNYNSKHNFNSISKDKNQIYHTSDERKRKSNLSLGSLNDTNDIYTHKEHLTKIKEEAAFKDNRAKSPFNEDDAKTQKLDYNERSDNQYDEEPEAEAKTQITSN